jgi:transmembrane sensor
MSGLNLQKPASGDANEVDELAGAWIIRKDLPGWSEEDHAALENWLAESPGHRIAYLRLRDVWERANRLQALSRSAHNVRRSRRQWRHLPAILRGVGLLMLVAIIGAAGIFYFSTPREAVYATAVGGHETVSLADGSQIELNTDTELRVSETGSQRTVKLEKGDAYFSVKHDNARPFVVLAGSNRIVDLGTRFEISSEHGALRVALLEGRARLESTHLWAQAHSVLLKPGDVAFATADAISLQKHSDEQLTNALGWRRGVLVFEHATLAEAVEEFNRYNRQQLAVVDPAVGRLKIDATLPVNGIDGFVRVAQDVLGVRASHQGSVIVISR